MNDELKCEYCGTVCADEDELSIEHRGCRLSAAFPDAATREGRLIVFDISKIKARLDTQEKPQK